MMRGLKSGWVVVGLCWAALCSGAAPALAAYNTAGSAAVATQSTVSSIASTTAGVVAGGIGSGIAGGTFTTVGSLTPNGNASFAGANQQGGLAFTGTGRSAGNGGNERFGVWVNAGWEHLNNSFTNTAFSGNTWAGALGADFKVMDRVIVGAAITGEDTKLGTRFNSGHLNTSGWGAGPYAAVEITKNFFVDVTGLYQGLSNTTDRSSGAITGSYHGYRWLGVANLNGKFSEANSLFLPQIAYPYVRQRDDAYSESGVGRGAHAPNTIHVCQGRLGGKIGYQFNQVTPYVGGRWEHNFTQPAISIPAGVGGGRPSPTRCTAVLYLGVLAKPW